MINKEHSTFFKDKCIATFVILLTTFLFWLPVATGGLFLPQIAREFGLTPAQTSALAGAVSFGTMLVIFVLGIIMDKVNMKYIMFTGLLLAGATVYGRAVVADYGMLYLVFVLFGVAMAFQGGSFRAISLWYEKDQILTMSAIVVALGALSFVVGLNTAVPVAEMLGGWRAYFQALGIISIICAFLWVTVVRSMTSRQAVLNESVNIKDIEKDSVFQNLKYVITSPRVWCCNIAEMAFIGGSTNFLTALAPLALMSSWGVTPARAGFLASMINMGSILGYLTLPTLMRKYYKGTPYLPAGACAVGSIILWGTAFLSRNESIFMVCLFLGGYLNGVGFAGPRSFLVMLPEVGGLRAGTALGVFNTMLRFWMMFWISMAGVVVGYLGDYSLTMAAMMCVGLINPIALYILYRLMKDQQPAAVE